MKLQKQVLLKLRVAKYAFSFFSISYLYLFWWSFCQNIYEVTIIFITNFQISFITQSSLLISTIVTGTGQFLETESPWKIMKNIFYFIVTNWMLWLIRFCTYYPFSFKQMSDIREVWKYSPLRDAFCLISQKLYRATILWWVDQKTSNF